MGLAEIRREYSLTGLRRRDLLDDPMAQFKLWFEHAASQRMGGRVRKFFVNLYKSLLLLGGAEIPDVNAMTLATVDADGNPSARIVLLKGADERGFVFYTNYQSRKGRELTGHPWAALVFYWADLERQVCVRGEVSQLSPVESDGYFRTRPRGSQVGAWASNQSERIADRAALEARWEEAERRFEGKEVPRPPHWGGYLLRPLEVEFWQGRPNRMHDRFVYRWQDGKWTVQRVCP